MAYGDFNGDGALKDAWDGFCDKLRATGQGVFKDYNPATALQRADGFRFLTQNLSQAFDLALETRDTRYPALHAFCSPIRKLGSDNADQVYLQAWVDGRSTYKISGKKGGARFWNLAVQGPRPTSGDPLHEPFGDIPEVNIFGEQLKTGWDGTFELYIGGEKQGENWLPTTPGTRKLFLRQCFDDWNEEAGAFRIERVGMDTPRPMPTPEVMIDAIAWAGEFMQNLMLDWPDRQFRASEYLSYEAVNRFGAVTQKNQWPSEALRIANQRRGRRVSQMRWSLRPDEALILEFDHGGDGFFQITNEGMFCNSMDYIYRQVSYTTSRTAVDSDGKVRFVLTTADPGYHNWVDTQGYVAGILSFRVFQTPDLPDLRTKVVKFADLARHLPADSRRASREDRVKQLQERFDGIRRRYRI
jgi:hypothetical protein